PSTSTRGRTGGGPHARSSAGRSGTAGPRPPGSSSGPRPETSLGKLRVPHVCGARTFCSGGVWGLREQKKLATRAALSWSAIRLIVERGYDKVLVEDIAA